VGGRITDRLADLGLAAVDRAFFDRPVLAVAADLLGLVLVHETPRGLVAARLTEVEAYDGANDPGSHAFRGRTKRNATMFGPPGHVYVYFTYGMHYCMNLVAGPPDVPTGVLLRAAEIIDGIDVARARRPAVKAQRDLARGPARLTLALGVGPQHDGADVCGGDDGPAAAGGPPGRLSLLADPAAPRPEVSTGPRVGLREAADRPWRFWIEGDPSVSVYRPHAPKKRNRVDPAPPDQAR
jgi:DNA-3-methyladenine glycosylase